MGHSDFCKSNRSAGWNESWPSCDGHDSFESVDGVAAAVVVVAAEVDDAQANVWSELERNKNVDTYKYLIIRSLATPSTATEQTNKITLCEHRFV